MPNEADHHRAASRSGFVLQMALGAQISAASQETGWEVAETEYPWRLNDASGYLDLVARRGSTYVAIESKKATQGTWYFFVPEKAQPTSLFKMYVNADPDLFPASGWMDWMVRPASLQAAFCHVGGQDDKGRGAMLERLTDELLPATNVFADEERWRSQANIMALPMIVTNCQLCVCSFDAAGVDLRSGELPPQATVTEVPFLRFRKALWSNHQETIGQPGQPPRYYSQRRERSVFVVNADALLDLLKSIHLYSRDEVAISGLLVR